jgi:hypothetical protein
MWQRVCCWALFERHCKVNIFKTLRITLCKKVIKSFQFKMELKTIKNSIIFFKIISKQFLTKHPSKTNFKIFKDFSCNAHLHTQIIFHVTIFTYARHFKLGIWFLSQTPHNVYSCSYNVVFVNQIKWLMPHLCK